MTKEEAEQRDFEIRFLGGGKAREPGSTAPERTDPTDTAAEAGAYSFFDKASLGLMPWALDKVAEMAGNKEWMGREARRARDESNHPIASTVGGIGGSIAPMLATGGIAGAAMPALRAGGLAGRSALGAVSGGTANLADQTSRAVIDDREINPTELAASTVLGGVTPKALVDVAHAAYSLPTFAARKALPAVPRSIKDLAALTASPKQYLTDKLLTPTLNAFKSQVPGATPAGLLDALPAPGTRALTPGAVLEPTRTATHEREREKRKRRERQASR